MKFSADRISVVSCTGSGKTSMAAALSRKLDLRHIELDSLHWGPNWTPREDFPARVAEATDDDGWVTDGNYSVVQQIVLERVQLVVWLDYSLQLVLYRFTRRTLGRIWRQEVLWAGNTETWRGHFASRDSLYAWAVNTHARRRRKYRRMMQDPYYRHIRFLRFRTPCEARDWFESLEEK